MTTLYTQNGKAVTLGKKLGIGGEGAVYAVNGHADKVAKIYHVSHLPDADKQAKLRFMAENAHSDLLGYIAWVEQTLHKRRGGRVIGFLMQKIDNCAPIHTLYNPSHRRQLYPNANWQFLLYTARNIAVAVATLHKHGHVIGDINQGNLLFGKDSKVTLIDADSFQIQTPDTTHLCHVGVAHFTPPELQGNSQFDRVARSQNHDCFGLALLIFHLLFGGRHPFSGVPLIDDAGNLLEHDIKHYRYAYAPDHNKRGIKPPPTAIPISLVPDDIQQLFIRAFTEVGRNNRPTANEWFKALEALRKNLQVCRAQKLHVYPRHLSSCPWCALEKRGLLFFSPQLPTQNLPKWDVYQRVFAYQKQYDTLPDYRAPITRKQMQAHFQTSLQQATTTYVQPEESLFSRIMRCMFSPLTALLRLLVNSVSLLVALVFALQFVFISSGLWLGEHFFPQVKNIGVAIWIGFMFLFIALLKYLTPNFGKNTLAKRLLLSQAEQAYQKLELELQRYEQLQTRYNQQKQQAQLALQKYQTIQQQLQSRQLSRTQAKHKFLRLDNELESCFLQMSQAEKRLKRIKLQHPSTYYRAAREYAQARASMGN